MALRKPVLYACILVGCALIAAGPATLLAPDEAAGAFGIAADSPEARGYILATASRDVALGVWLLALLALKADPRILAASVGAISVVAAADAVNVLTSPVGRPFPALIGHAGGLVVLLVLGWWLWKREPAGNGSAITGR